MRRYKALASLSAKIATEVICSFRNVFMTRTAISPRLATNTLLILLLFIEIKMIAQKYKKKDNLYRLSFFFVIV